MTVLLAFLVDLLLNIAGWAICSIFETDLIYDLTGSISFISVAAVSIWAGDSIGSRQLLASTGIALWALRLGSFLFIRAVRNGGDKRLEKYKTKPWSFLVLWLVQSVWVLMGTLPVLTISGGAPSDVSASQWDIGCIAGWVTGVLVQIIADEQKRAFNANPRNKGRFISSGLWKYSRHPNYFGQMLLNVSMALFCLPAMGASTTSWVQCLAVLSPLFEIWLLLRLSGIPPLEKTAKDRWGDDPAYRRYVASTNVLIPWIPKQQPTSGRGNSGYDVGRRA